MRKITYSERSVQDCLYLMEIYKLDHKSRRDARKFRIKPPRLLVLAALLVNLAAFGQSTASDAYLTVNYVGYAAGQYQLQVVSKQDASCNPDIFINWDGVKISAVTPSNKGQINSAKVTGASTTFYLTGPYVAGAKFVVLDLSICQWEGSAPAPITVSAAPASLPIVLNYFKYAAGAFQWQTAQESNSAFFQVQRQADGDTTWTTIGSALAAGNSSTATNYSMAWGGVATASILGLFICLGLACGLIKKYRDLSVAALILVAAVSCTKTNAIPHRPTTAGSYRLVEVDKDGATTYSKIIHI